MLDLWEKEFTPTEIKTPYMIVNEQCQLLSKKTDGKIFACITKYDGAFYDDLQDEPPWRVFSGNNKIPFGEKAGIDKLTYEFYLTSKATPKYKYRVFVIRFDITSYPVYFFLDEDIADEINLDGRFSCEDEESFIRVFKNIINSGRMTEIINSLLAVNY